MKKVVNYGKQLKKYLKKSGISATHASKVLGITRGTLYNRFEDGEFSEKELEKVKEFIK